MTYKPMTEEEISHYTLRNYGIDTIAMIKEMNSFTEELLKMPPEEAKKASTARLFKAGIVDEYGNPSPNYYPELYTEWLKW